MLKKNYMLFSFLFIASIFSVAVKIETSNTKGNVKDGETSTTCSERNTYTDEFEISSNSWHGGPPLTSGYLSFIESLAGKYVNFYIFNRFGMKEPFVNTGITLFDKSQSFYALTSVCEMVRYGYLPYEKVVINVCKGQSCGFDCDTPSSAWLSTMIADVKSTNLLGGLSVGNVEFDGDFDVLSSYKNVILENTNISSFFTEPKDGYIKYSSDVPRFILNIEAFPSLLETDIATFMSDSQKQGFNYIVLNGYDFETDTISESVTIHASYCLYDPLVSNSCVNGEKTKVLGKVPKFDELVVKLTSGDLNFIEKGDKIIKFLNDSKLDGLVLELKTNEEMFDFPNNLCTLSLMLKYIYEKANKTIIAINADIGDMVPFVEHSIMTEEKKTEIWNSMDYDSGSYQTCYTTLINSTGAEWENNVPESSVYKNDEYTMPDNRGSLAKDFYEVNEV